MNKLRLIIGALVLLVSGQVGAVIIGDKDWRQVTGTTNYSWNDFDTIFDTTTGSCDAVGCLLSNGNSTVDLTG